MNDAHLLLDLDRMLPELRDTEEAGTRPRSPNLAPTSTSGRRDDRLPYGLDRLHGDNPDEPAGNRTAAGILLWAAQWATAFESWYGRAYGGALPYLAHIAPTAATGHPDEWAALMDEARPIWARTARTCGYLPEPAGDCWCGHTLYREPTSRGLSDDLVCDGPGEHWYPDQAHAHAAYQHHARQHTTPGVMLTLDQLRVVWPGLDRRTLHSWGTRGHVTKYGHGGDSVYDLAHINQRINQRMRDTPRPRAA